MVLFMLVLKIFKYFFRLPPGARGQTVAIVGILSSKVTILMDDYGWLGVYSLWTTLV